MGIVDDYTSAVYDERKVHAAYPPLSRLKLGDIGQLDGKRFTRLGNLADLKKPIAFQEDDPQGLSRVEFKNEFKVKQARAVKLGAGAKLDVAGIVTVRATLTVEFSSGFGAYVGIAGAVVRRISNVKAIGEELIRRTELGEKHPDYWNHGRYRVVTQVIEAKKVVVLMSREEKSKIVLQAKADIPKIDLADVNLDFDMLYDDSSEDQWYPDGTSTGAATPFMWLMKVNVPILGDTSFIPASFGIAADAPATTTFDYDGPAFSLEGFRP